LTAALTSLGGQQRELALVHDDLAHVDEVGDRPVDDEEGEVGPDRLGVHDQRRVHAHLGASWRAAPSARLSCGSGRVKDTCTMPSPVVSP
jgi:hypothetical protein